MFNRTLLILSFICLISCTKEIIQQKLTVSVTPANGGSVSPPSNSYEKGSNVSLVATPTGEYLFKQWQGSISGTSNPTSITMDADKSVTGVFEKRQYPLTLTIEGSGTVKEEVIALATQALYPSGTTVRLTAQPADKFLFGGWSGDLTSTANPLDLKIDKTINLKITFNKDPDADRINLKTFDYDIDFTGIDFGTYGLAGQIDPNVSQTILYTTKDGLEHIIINPAYIKTTPPLHFILKNGSWLFENKYPEAAMDGFRNYDPVDNNGTYVIANHGNEVSNPRPYGDVFVVKTTGEKLSWTKVSEGKSFYHSAAGGDLDGDGLFDISAVSMGTYANWWESPHLYKQISAGTFNQTREYLDTTGFIGKKLGLGATLISDVLGDSRNELIIAEYGFNTTFNKNFNERYGVSFFNHDKASGKLKYIRGLQALGVYSNPDRGTTSIKTADIDKDGDKDILVAVEGSDEVNAVQIFTNDGKGNFSPGQIISFKFDDFQFREFELTDINQDGYADILFHSFHYGKLFRIDPKNISLGVKLQNSIWVNNKGTFEKYSKEINIPNIRPGFLKGFFINGKVKFVGFGEPSNRNYTFSNKFKLYEIVLNLF